MKNIGGKQFLQFILLATIVAIVGFSFVNNLYGPFPIRDKGFLLQPVWEIKLNDSIRQVIVSENDNIFVRLSYSVNSLSLETGKLRWKYRIDKPIYSIAAYKGIIYVIGKEVLFTLDEESGKLLWQQATVINSPSLAPEIRYVDDDALIAVDYGYVYFLNSQTGEIKQYYYLGKGIADTCVYQDKVYTFNRDINAYDIKNGTLLWEDLSNEYPSGAVCENEIAYFYKNNSELIAFDFVNRSQVWAQPLQPSDPYNLRGIFSAPNFLVVEGPNEMFIVDKDKGELIHTVPSAGYMSSKTIIGSELFVFYIHSQEIYSYDIQTWKNTGNLQVSFPQILATEEDRFLKYDKQLLLWNGKRLFLYR